MSYDVHQAKLHVKVAQVNKTAMSVLIYSVVVMYMYVHICEHRAERTAAVIQ